MRSALLVALCGLGACGDNLLPDGVPLVASHDLVIVAHQDDDLLFMQPDLVEAVRSGDGVTSVYVTAGNGVHGVELAQERYRGLMAAYAAAAGNDAWSCGWIELAEHVAEHCRLDAGNVSLVFLGYPDGGKLGEHPNSLLHLWEGTIAGAATIADRTAHYDRDGLIDTLAEVIRLVEPATIRSLEAAATHGHDHADHMIVGALALLATARTTSHAELLSYRGYDIDGEPANKLEAVYAPAIDMLAHYEACVYGCAPCGQACPSVQPGHEIWLRRRYAVGYRRNLAGQLRLDGRCLDVDASGTVTLTDCTTAGPWRLDTYGQLHLGDRCLEARPTGELTASGCTGGVSRTFIVDDEDHVWAAVPPPAEAGMDYAHLGCLASDSGQPRVALCGADHAPVWELVPETHVTPRAALGITATGRAVRLGDLTGDGKADLCAIEPTGLWCAPGDGAGGFSTAIRIDTMTAPLAADPGSLAIGDVDGDHRLDACGRDASGVLCATAATGFAAQRWTPSFGDGDARGGTSASLAAIDANGDGKADICGVVVRGVICAPKGLTLAPIVRSAWPDPATLVWPGDLDGDHQADWCAATDAGPACGVDAERALTTDGAPWGFALGGVVETVAATPDTTGLADIDGDGRADLCSLGGGKLACARSQGRGFGPRTMLAPLDGSALWLGDLDGDGIADACVDTGTAITCVLVH